MTGNSSVFNSVAWAVFISRVLLGILFLMTGWFKVFEMGAENHARQLFVEAYADNWIPQWLLWFTGYIIPYFELAAGVFLIVGLRTFTAALTVGFILILVTYGHLLQEPFFDITTHILPRTILLLFVLYLIDKDSLSIDHLIERKKA